MNLSRIALATVGAFVAYFAVGGIGFVVLPSLKDEFLKYPAVYRSHEGQISRMPIAMAAMFLSILVLTVMYALLCQGGSGIAQGARFGALIGVFVICDFVVHNYVNLNVGLKLTVIQAIAYFVEWVVTGIVIGLTYRPSLPH